MTVLIYVDEPELAAGASRSHNCAMHRSAPQYRHRSAP
jgi:hypothetical protein